jgi:flagellar FliL protein
MAEEIENEDAEDSGEGSEDEEGGKKKKMSGKKLVLFVVLPVLLLAIGGGAGWYFFMSGGEEEIAEGEEGSQEHAEPLAVFFYDLPEMLVNLSSSNGKVNYLKLSVAIELADEESIAFIEPLLPRVIDRFQVYLRGLRVADLNGSAGMYHLKNELMRRVNAAVPVEIKDVLFKEMIVQ